MLRWGMPAHAGVAWFTLENAWATPGYACSRWGRLVHAGERLGHAGECLLMLGNACSRWGRLVHAGERLATLGDACFTLGNAWLRWGTPASHWGTPAHAGDAWLRWGTPASRWGTPAHAGDAWPRWEMPGSRWGSTWCHARLGSLLGCWCTRGPLCLSPVIEVKYAPRGPPYIAGSELLSRVFWCESQLLIGSSRSMSIREAPECLGRFDVRYTSNPCCIIGMCGMCHPKFTARLSRVSGGQAP